jgi:hypothetical protein
LWFQRPGVRRPPSPSNAAFARVFRQIRQKTTSGEHAVVDTTELLEHGVRTYVRVEHANGDLAPERAVGLLSSSDELRLFLRPRIATVSLSATSCTISKLRYSDPVAWRVEVLDRRVEQELEALALDVRQKFARIVNLIEQHGLPAMREP